MLKKEIRRKINNLTNLYIKEEKDANIMLSALGIISPPVPTVKLIKFFFPDSVIEMGNLAEEIFGCSFVSNGVWRILVNRSLPDGAKRFTVLHELRHMVNGEPGSFNRGLEKNTEEKLANYFAACILMPARWFRKEWERVGDVDKMAEIFGVSRAAVEVRLKTLEHYLAAE